MWHCPPTIREIPDRTPFVALPQKRNNMEEISVEKVHAGSSQTVHSETGGWCNPGRTKVQSRRKYVFTDQIDQLIREIYLNHRDAKTRPGIRLLAKKVGMPHWALKKRARELGLARTKELPWSERELGILARYAWMSDERIRLKLKAAGYSRTVTGIHLKLRRMGFKHDGSFYSANGLAQALGIDSHAVTRWIKSGHLKAKLRGTARTEQQNGDCYLIHEKDVRRFICNSAHNFAAFKKHKSAEGLEECPCFQHLAPTRVGQWKHNTAKSTDLEA